jgi:hypothetical protein
MTRETFSRNIFIVVAVMLLTCLLGRAATTSTAKHKDSLGIVMQQTNPNSYEAVVHIVEATDVDGNLNLRVNPLGTYMLYDDIVLLCGMPLDKFSGVQEPFVMAYERVSHHAVDGVGCHDLVSVHHIEIKGLDAK